MPIRHRWADIVATDHAALADGEWAGVRNSTRAERNEIGAGRRDVCHTFVFRHCGAFLRLIITQDVRQPSFTTRVVMGKAVRDMVAQKRLNVPEAYSCCVLGIAAAAAPQALGDLRRVQANSRCQNCTCVLREDGPLNPESPQGAFIENELSTSQVAKRMRADVYGA